MTHLDGASDEDLKNQVLDADSNAEDEKATKEDTNPKLQEKLPFSFRYTDDRGKVWEGEFVNEILDITAKGQAAVLESSLNQGVPYDSMPRMMSSVHQILAHLTFSLITRPSWAKNLRKLKDTSIIFALFEEVASHEATFHGRSAAEEEGEEGGE